MRFCEICGGREATDVMQRVVKVDEIVVDWVCVLCKKRLLKMLVSNTERVKL